MFLSPRAITRTSAIALATALAASPASADLSADQAWDDLVEWLETGSGEVTFAEEIRDGATLTIRGVAARADGPDMTSATLMDQITLTELGDGTVQLDLPDQVVIATTTTVDGQSITNDVPISVTGDRIILSGDNGVDRYDYSVDEMALSFDDLNAGDDAPEVDVRVSIVAAGITGTYDVSTDEMRQIVSKGTTDQLTISAAGSAPEGSSEPGAFQFAASMRNLQTEGSVSMPLTAATTDFGAMTDAGFAYDASISYQDGTMSATGDTPDGTFEFEASNEAGTFNIGTGPGGFFLETGSRNISMTAGGSQVPIPGLVWTAAESGSTFQMPLMADPAPQRFAFGTKLIDFVVPDMIYGMFDPAGLFPRDPASLEISLNGTVLLNTDITDPALEDMDSFPGELKTVDVTTLRLALAGAELTGDGAFTFTTDENNMPVPDGVANLMLTGGNALLDTLVQMGLIPEQQAMGARMMVGLFAQPGDGPDTLTSTIEVREGNQVFANGQRIR